MSSLDLEKRVNQRNAIRTHMDRIGRKILVMSGKGGVGKTTVTVELAKQLAAMDQQVGILDTDLHGPNVAALLDIDLASRFNAAEDGSLKPVAVHGNLSIAGVDAAMKDRTDATLWRGPMKSMIINDLLARVDWGDRDFLLIDSPPGSGDEQITVCKSIPELTGAIIVTTAQKLSMLDAVRSVMFCRKMGIAILGIVENMSRFSCPQCGHDTGVSGSEEAQRMADSVGAPLLGSIPIVVPGQSRERMDQAFGVLARFLIQQITCSR